MILLIILTIKLNMNCFFRILKVAFVILGGYGLLSVVELQPENGAGCHVLKLN